MRGMERRSFSAHPKARILQLSTATYEIIRKARLTAQAGLTFGRSQKMRRGPEQHALRLLLEARRQPRALVNR